MVRSTGSLSSADNDPSVERRSHKKKKGKTYAYNECKCQGDLIAMQPSTSLGPKIILEWT